MNKTTVIMGLIVVAFMILTPAILKLSAIHKKRSSNEANSSEGKTAFMSLGMVIVMLLSLVIGTVFTSSDWVTYHWYYKPLYAIFGKFFYFPFWLYEFNQLGWAFAILFMVLLCLIFKIKMVRVRHLIIGLFLAVMFAPPLMALLFDYQDFKYIMNNKYVVKDVFAYAPFTHWVGGYRGGFTEYCLNIDNNANYYNYAFDGGCGQLDIIGYRALCGYQNTLRQQFVAHNNIDYIKYDITEMDNLTFEDCLGTNDRNDWEKFQQAHKIRIYYLPQSKFIFKYEWSDK